MSNKNSVKSRFIHNHIYLNGESELHYIVIIETIEGVLITGTYTVKVPKPYLRCTINPYCVN